MTGCFDWTEINYGQRVRRQVTRWLVLMVHCDRAVIRVGSPDCVCKCFPGSVGCIIVDDDAYWWGFVNQVHFCVKGELDQTGR